MQWSDERNEIAAALAEFTGKVGPVAKTKTGKISGKSKATGNDYSYEYGYADLSDQREHVPDGQAVTSDGEIVPGVAVTPGGSPRNFSVRFETHGRSAIAAAWSDGRFGGALPGMAPALPEVRS